MKRGDNVRQIVRPIEGVVTKFLVDQETGDRMVEITWTDADGEVHSRPFKEEDFQLIQ